MNIQFLGATETVTGSKYLLNTHHTQCLIDCGLFQGFKTLRLRNWAPLPISPSRLKHVLLTHAHIDHSGYLPLLIKNGFSGKILCTKATKALCEILLPDSGHLHEEEAHYANQKGYSKHHPALPLYTQIEAEHALKYFHTVDFEEPYPLDESTTATFHYAGHILGASFIRIQHHQKSILFSGDLGRSCDPIMYPPTRPIESDYLVIESTYGNRLHDQIDPMLQLQTIINTTFQRNGSVIIPSFAVGRTQMLLYYLYQLKRKNAIPNIPIYVDSPMATNATKIFAEHTKENRLTAEQAREVCQVAQYIHSVEESIALKHLPHPIILISASGMATGGRIVHHIRHFAPHPQHTILFSGYQVPGTRGDRMIQKEKTIKMFGEMVPIRAQIAQLENLSAHADYAEILQWLSMLRTPPKTVFITHGGIEAAKGLQSSIEQRFHWHCEIPTYLSSYHLKV